MANHKSSVKRAKQTVTKTARNKSKASGVKTAVKAVRQAIESKDKSKASELLKVAQSLLGKLAKIGVIKTATAGRRTSRLAEQVAKL